ncbi:SRPBCC family protein [Paenibacillus gansuensis]|uniref:SRPBCC domain-containing protein n=1 Tax=Paenibacillus gansuensis TaxID=306542 RepID=A0ABW5PI91_9BACL
MSATALPDVVVTELFNAPIGKVWDAVSTSEGIAAWFMPNTFQPELGREFTLTSQYEVSVCKVTELDPPNKLMFTWGKHWVITLELKAVSEEQTEFTLIHGGWDAAITEANGMNHTAIRERMGGGWKSNVVPALRRLVESEGK